MDLDALIGEMRREASRRRAAPDFPIDDEARLGQDLDRQAPRPLVSKLHRFANAAHDLSSETLSDSRPTTTSERIRRTVTRGLFLPVANRLASLAELVSEALRTVSTDVAQLDARLARIEHPVPGRPAVVPLSPASIEGWRSRLPASLSEPAGRVLYVGDDAEDSVTSLRRVGIDAYGLATDGDRFRTHPDVRHGDLLDHLAAVGPDALGAVVLVGLLAGPDRTSLDQLTGQLGRVTTTVMVISEAPWWWRERVGSVDADLAAARPLGAETWLALLRTVGFTGSAEYGPGAVTYRVVAHR